MKNISSKIILLAILLFVGLNLFYSPALHPGIVSLIEKYPSPPADQNGLAAFMALKPEGAWDGKTVVLGHQAEIINYSSNCWFKIRSEEVRLKQNDQSGKKRPDNCLPEEKLAQLLEKNQALFSQLKKIMGMPRYYVPVSDEPMRPLAYNMSDLQNYFSLGIVYKIRNGQSEEAYQDWALQRRFFNVAMTDVQPDLTYTFSSLINLSVFQILYEAYPEVIAKHAAEILPLMSALSVDDVGEYLMKGYLGNYNYLQSYDNKGLSHLNDDGVKEWWEQYLYDSHDVYNGLYEKQRTIAVVYEDKKDLASVCAAFENVPGDVNTADTDLWPIALHYAGYFYNPVGKFVVDNYWISKHMGIAYLQSIVRMRALGVLTLAMQNQVAPEAMEDFLEGLPEEWQYASRGIFFQYDMQAREISYEKPICGAPEDRGFLEDQIRFRIPYPVSANN